MVRIVGRKRDERAERQDREREKKKRGQQERMLTAAIGVHQQTSSIVMWGREREERGLLSLFVCVFVGTRRKSANGLILVPPNIASVCWLMEQPPALNVCPALLMYLMLTLVCTIRRGRCNDDDD